MMESQSLLRLSQVAFTFVLLNLAILPAQAAKSAAILEIKLDSSVRKQTYLVEQDAKKRAYSLVFKTPELGEQRDNISSRQVDLLIADVNRITWSAQYRKPSSLKSCSKFAQVNLREEKATVCSEDSASTGKMMGVVDSLRKKFK